MQLCPYHDMLASTTPSSSTFDLDGPKARSYLLVVGGFYVWIENLRNVLFKCGALFPVTWKFGLPVVKSLQINLKRI